MGPFPLSPVEADGAVSFLLSFFALFRQPLLSALDLRFCLRSGMLFCGQPELLGGIEFTVSARMVRVGRSDFTLLHLLIEVPGLDWRRVNFPQFRSCYKGNCNGITSIMRDADRNLQPLLALFFWASPNKGA